MPRPICVKCHVEMRCRKNNFPVHDPAVGDFPSTYWLGDLFACPGCGTQIITDFGVAIHPSRVTGYVRDEKDFEFRYELPARLSQ